MLLEELLASQNATAVSFHVNLKNKISVAHFGGSIYKEHSDYQITRLIDMDFLWKIIITPKDKAMVSTTYLHRRMS